MTVSYKVFIADDDLPILQSLKNFPWEQHGCRLVGEATNGEEAVEQCRQIRPDIIITDIVMPRMDGIELAKALKQCNPYVQIIIITSYRDFEYAKEAITLGVKEYLIKGVYTDEELILALNRAKEEFDKESYSLKYKNEADFITKNEELVNVLLQKNHIEDGNTQFLIKFPSRFVMIHMVWSKAPGLLYEKKLSEILYNYRCTNSLLNEIIINSVNEIHLLYEESDTERVTGDIMGIMNEMENSFDESCLRCYASIGDVIFSPQQYKSEVEKNRCALKMKFYNEDCHVYVADHISFRHLSKEERHDIINTVNSHMSAEELEQYLKGEFSEYLSANGIDPEDVKQLFFIWLSDKLKTSFFDDTLFDSVADENVLNLKDLLSRWVAVYSQIQQHVFAKGRYEICRALEIINQRFSSNLTADEIAREIGLSPNYFGYVFKKSTGFNFKEYLTKIRMEKALYLIKSTNLKIYEVAERVGIRNYRYFISVFQKYYKKNPSEIKGAI